MRLPFVEALASGRVLLMDGAMGTELARAGREERADLIAATRRVHRAYLDAGATALLTNTFQANPAADPAFSSTIKTMVAAARTEAGPSRYVLFDAGPVVGPNRKEFDDWDGWRAVIDVVRAHAHQLDGFLIETCSSETALRAAEGAALAGLPVLLSLWFRKRDDGEYQTIDGHRPEWFAGRAGGLTALGVNCGPEMSVADCAAVLRRYRGATALPLFARPNAGTPVVRGEDRSYPLSPAALAEAAPELLAAGARMLGGCCGTTPAHIAAVRQLVDIHS